MEPTAITTAARRIAREASTTPREIRIYFDTEGHVLDRHMADVWYADPDRRPTAAIAIVGGRLTQRAAQDLLDAQAAHPDDRDAQNMYLDNLTAIRERETLLADGRIQ